MTELPPAAPPDQSALEAALWQARYVALARRVQALDALLQDGRGRAARDAVEDLLQDLAEGPAADADAVLRGQIDDFCEDCEILLADGYDAAFVGLAYRACSEPVACYDYDHCLLIVQANGVPDPADAEDFFSYNTLGSYVGPKTPVFVQRMPR